MCAQCHLMLAKPTVTLRSMAQILGMLKSYRPAPLHIHMLQAQLTQSLHRSQGNYGIEVALSLQSRQKLQWCTHNIEVCNGSPVVTPSPHPDLTIFTDTSKHGWGQFATIRKQMEMVCCRETSSYQYSRIERCVSGITSPLGKQILNNSVSHNMDNSNSPAPNLHQLEVRSQSSPLGCFQPELERAKGVCFSTIQSDTGAAQQISD